MAERVAVKEAVVVMVVAVKEAVVVAARVAAEAAEAVPAAARVAVAVKAQALREAGPALQAIHPAEGVETQSSSLQARYIALNSMWIGRAFIQEVNGVGLG
ncbi:MAG: hypothetical protein Q8K18_17260 [Burkholderiales bacterium]|nr:hypothetical protein [Burkholderiales bacterium]